MHDNIVTVKLSSDNGRFILLCIISVLVIIAVELLAVDNTNVNCFNKHVFKDYLPRAASVNTIKMTAVKFIQQAFKNCREFTRESPKDNIEKINES